MIDTYRYWILGMLRSTSKPWPMSWANVWTVEDRWTIVRSVWWLITTFQQVESRPKRVVGCWQFRVKGKCFEKYFWTEDPEAVVFKATYTFPCLVFIETIIHQKSISWNHHHQLIHRIAEDMFQIPHNDWGSTCIVSAAPVALDEKVWPWTLSGADDEILHMVTCFIGFINGYHDFCSWVVSFCFVLP